MLEGPRSETARGKKISSKAAGEKRKNQLERNIVKTRARNPSKRSFWFDLGADFVQFVIGWKFCSGRSINLRSVFQSNNGCTGICYRGCDFSFPQQIDLPSRYAAQYRDTSWGEWIGAVRSDRAGSCAHASVCVALLFSFFISPHLSLF